MTGIRERLSTLDQKYWLLCISACLAVGLIAALIIGLAQASETALYLVMIGGPGLFGAIFIYSLRSTIGISYWRGFLVLIVFVVAHWCAFLLAVASDGFPHRLVVQPFIYGATFAFVVATGTALVYPSARSALLVAITMLASGFVTLIFRPLMAVLDVEEFSLDVIVYVALSITFGLVYAVVAAFLGWRLFERSQGLKATSTQNRS